MNTSVFKAYDIRGKYPDEINEEVAYVIGLSYGSYLQEFLDKTKCVIGMDNRLSSESLKASLKKGLLASGINVIDYGEITTPMHYYTRYMEKTYGLKFQKGCSGLVKTVATEFIKKYGKERLKEVCKAHFRTYNEV